MPPPPSPPPTHPLHHNHHHHHHTSNGTTVSGAESGNALLRGCAGQSEYAGERHGWRKPIVAVVAVYKEWTSAIPAWACPDEAANYTVAPFYQRLDPSAPRFVPNFANEAGVYLKFVVDHYWHLPELTAFVQADAGNEHLHYAKSGVRGVPVSRRIGSLNVAAIREAGVGYLPLADLALQRATSFWRQRGYAADVKDCWLRVASWFGHPEAFQGMREPTVTVYCCNYFAVTRENIRRIPWHTWNHVYQALVVNGTCHDVPAYTTVIAPDRDRGKHEAAGAFEHLAHLIWGGSEQTAHYSGPH